MAVLVLTILLVVLPAIILAVVLARLRRANRVCPDVDCGAPLRWLVWPFPTAVLHRRLRTAVVLARAAAPRPPSSRRRRHDPAVPTVRAELAVQLEQHAVAIDRDLVLAARLRGAPRRRLLVPAARQVAEVERLAARLHAAGRAADAGPLGRGHPEAALARLHDDIVALEAAYDEVHQVEAAALGRVRLPA